MNELLKFIREGDTLIVWRLDRLGRSLPELIKMMGELEANDIAFESITERINTQTAAGQLIFHVFAYLAEFERRLIYMAGLRIAKARGRHGGRLPLSKEKIAAIKAMAANG